jgi:excinuclease UvrABC nuclease subunit
MLHRDDLLRVLDPDLGALVGLFDSPRHPFSSLAETDVPDTAGLYVIYRDDPAETLYVGKASDLRFRIMKNHLAYRGDDNFVRYLMQDVALSSKSDARTYIRKLCSVHWLEVHDSQRLAYLEHLAIAATRARFNKG